MYRYPYMATRFVLKRGQRESVLFDWLRIRGDIGSMSDARLTRLGDFLSGAGSTVLVVTIAFPRWWIVLAGLLLMAIAMGLYVVQHRREKTSR